MKFDQGRTMILLIIVLVEDILCFNFNCANKNNSFVHQMKKSRPKRFLLFNNYGLYKVLIGVGMPIKVGSRQSIAEGFNIQFGYPIVTSLDEIRKPFPPILKRSNRKRNILLSPRELLYLGIEAILTRQGFTGRKCLLKLICENAFTSFANEENGLLGQLFDIILSAGLENSGENLDKDYLEAQKAGDFGVDCNSMYSNSNCPKTIFDLLN